MKAAEKIEKPDELRAHFQSLADKQIQVRLFTRGGKFLSTARVRLAADSADGLRLSSFPFNWSDYPVLSFHYNYGECSCVFQARPVGVRETYLQVELPGAVLLFDRREHFRVKPAPLEPVVVRIWVPEMPQIRLNAADVSSGGFSVLVPRRMRFFGMGLTMPVAIDLPHEERISTEAVVMGSYTFLDVSRIGYKFTHLCEKARGALMSYCVQRQLNQKDTTVAREEKDGGKPRVCVIDSNPAPCAYNFLKPMFALEIVNHPNAIADLRQRPTDLIVLDVEHDGAWQILQTVTRDRSLQALPLILLGRGLKTMGRAGAVMPINLPYDQAFLVHAMQEMICKVRLSKRIADAYYRCFTGEGKKIVILDPLKRLATPAFKVLEELEFQLCWIQSEADILSNIEAAGPDLLLLDSETGAEAPDTLCRRIHRTRAIRGIPKIRLLSGGEPVPTSLPDDAGIHFLNKPFDDDQLLQEVNRALGRNL